MIAAQLREDRHHRVEPDFWDIDPRRSRDDAWTAIERGFVDQDSGDGGVNSATERVFHTERRHHRHRR
jgi:hypothetical protein